MLHDLGGVVGLKAALDHPERARALVAVNTFAWPPDQFGLRLMLRIMGSAPLREIDAWTNFLPRMSATRFGVGRRASKAGRRAFLGGFHRRSPRRSFHRLMQDVRRATPLFAEVEHGLRTELRDRPLLTVFAAGNDPFGFQARFGSLVAEVQEVVVPGRSHFPMCDDPDAFADAVSLWYASHVAD